LINFSWSQDHTRDSILSALQTDLEDEERLSNLLIVTKNAPEINEFYALQKQALKLADKLHDSVAHTELMIMEGLRYFNMQEDEKGMQILMDELAKCEKRQDSIAMSRINYTLGVHYFYKQDVENAVKYMELSVFTYPDYGNIIGKATPLMALGVVLQNTPRLEESIKYQMQALQIKEDAGAIESLPISLNNIAELYYELGKTEDAHETVDRSIHLSDSLGIVWALYYAKFIKGEMFNKEKRFDEAFPLIEEAVNFWEEQQSWKDLTRGYSGLSIAYKGARMPFKAMTAMSNYVTMKDSVHNQEKRTAANEIATKYETEKNELLLAQEKEAKEFAQKESELIQEASKTRLIVFAVIGLILVINALYFYKRYKDQRKDKELIAQQKQQIEVRSQEIMDSIIYAKRIQSAILPRENLIKKLLPDSFVYYKPKDVVAGDFYWLEETKDGVLFAAADCTGHGVPGAMVSVVCNNGFLEQNKRSRS
jgi:tetratricopeptide (TPR) repeat protein